MYNIRVKVLLIYDLCMYSDESKEYLVSVHMRHEFTDRKNDMFFFKFWMFLSFFS